ncbi:MAG: tRNA preQ1(34) S-adenosylmethionine ribosyltransferase-isomerase QueA [Eggerthellaceae bacterium]|nr:tRNA preQ1(34) S-adenosylmethionine ribosyltransferase-isomerase QueA [Eggerthellaceae bacterium]
MKTSDFDYELPAELIAQEPMVPRDACRLLVMDRKTGEVTDRIFSQIIDELCPGDLLVANETRVMPARLLGQKHGSGGSAEVFLLRQSFAVSDADYPGIELGTDKADSINQISYWEVLVRPGKRLKPASDPEHAPRIDFTDCEGKVVLSAQIADWSHSGQKGERLARLFTPLQSMDAALHAVGHTPLPPYIKDYAGDEELYQTVYSQREASAAAPTAGLHFTPELIERIEEAGIMWSTVELEVGLDTFRIVDEDDPTSHIIHTEYYTVPQETIDAIQACKERGGRVIAVGTTSVRSLESAWDEGLGCVCARNREATSLFILPGYSFRVVDALITNFHVPRSTLMMLVSAFSTRDNIMAAYQHAIQSRYRMLSFGDAMFIR